MISFTLLLEIRLCIVTGIDQQLFVVVRICEYRLTKVRRNHACAVVICLGIIYFYSLTLQDLANHLNYLRCQSTGILEYGHGLLAVDHVLYVCDITVLTCNNRVIACVVCCQSVLNTESGGVVGAKRNVKRCAVRLVGRKDVLHSCLCSLGSPCRRTNGCEINLAGGNNDLSGVHVRL